MGDREYPVDISLPPVFFFPTYLEVQIPQVWRAAQDQLTTAERHPLAVWLEAFDAFLAAFKKLENRAKHRDILSAPAKALLILAYDMYSLNANRLLQNSLVARLLKRDSFQGALHEVFVAATMMRAGFNLDFEDESDSRRKHPEFVATHRQSRASIAVEAKSIHRKGVLAYEGGRLPPTIESGTPNKIAAQVCGQVQRALPKALNLPLYVFVDLSLPPAVADHFAPLLVDEFRKILPQIDHGWDENGISLGRIINLVTMTNRSMYFGKEIHSGGDTLNLFLHPPASDCRFPDASRHVPDVKSAVKEYGSIPAY